MVPSHTCTRPYKYRTRYRIFNLFLSSPRVWMFRLNLIMSSPSNNGLNRLVEASSLTDTLRGIQQDLRSLWEDVNCLKENDSTPHLPWSGDERTLEPITPRSGVQEPVDRIPGTNWAKEMDILDPILTEEPSDAARIVEVMPRTEVCIKASFQSMCNATWRTLRGKFILPKAPTTLPLTWTRFMPTHARRALSRQTGPWRACRCLCWTPWGHYRRPWK